LLFSAAVIGGCVLTLLLIRRPPGAFLRPPHARTNYRGATVAGTLGAALAVPLAAGAVPALAAGAPVRIVVAVVGSGFACGALGLADDVYGDRSAGGLLGHAAALLRGRVTTGTAKAAGGAAVGLGAARLAGWRGGWWLIAGAVVAMGAHVANLLDVRPGRALKVWIAMWVALCTTRFGDAVVATAALGGGAVAFLPADLRERVMLGDAGAGLLGASLGAAAVATVGRTALVVCAAGLALLTAASEVVSFTRVIERVGPLRWADRLGRPPPAERS
jgi:UDP-N-acetylmuramyl pentapeptide phosphotransferase/UDP-N-acetylglucosamine-1-phosphate transferase